MAGILLLAALTVLPSAAAQATAGKDYAPLVEKILGAWEKYDLVCLGEDHGRKHDSDLRIALVRHPRFPEIVRTILVEFANAARQDVLDRFILEGKEMTRAEIGVVWRDASNPETWECPIYEEFFRAVREVNLGLPREKRIRVICGDGPIDWPKITTSEQLAPLMNRGGSIRRIIAEQALDKKVKALAIYGSGHCTKMGMGFPGELADRYPSRMWSVSSFYNVPVGRKTFGLGDQPAYIVVTGTKWESAPVGDMFPGESADTLAFLFDAIVYYGDVPDIVVPADLTELKAKYGAELERRRRLIEEAVKLLRRRSPQSR